MMVLRYCWRVNDWVLRKQRNDGECHCMECNDAREAQARITTYWYVSFSYC